MTDKRGCVYAYVGQRRSGVSVYGSTTEHPSTFVKRMYEARWRWLSVTLKGASGGAGEVGAIVQHPDNGRPEGKVTP